MTAIGGSNAVVVAAGHRVRQRHTDVRAVDEDATFIGGRRHPIEGASD